MVYIHKDKYQELITAIEDTYLTSLKLLKKKLKTSEVSVDDNEWANYYRGQVDSLKCIVQDIEDLRYLLKLKEY